MPQAKFLNVNWLKTLESALVLSIIYSNNIANSALCYPFTCRHCGRIPFIVQNLGDCCEASIEDWLLLWSDSFVEAKWLLLFAFILPGEA
jgi:hypothetical protein